MLRKLAIHIPKKDFRHVFTPHPIINSVWVKVLNLRGENVKLKETNIRTKFHDLGFDHGFLDMSTRRTGKNFFSSKSKNETTPPTRNICASKDTIKKVKGQSGKWKKLVHFSCSVVSDSLCPHGLQHARPPCPSPTPEFTQTQSR